MAFIHGSMIAAFTVAGAASPQQTAAPAGNRICAGCRGQMVAQFDRAVHSAVGLKEGGTSHAGCEACHGRGAKHAEAGGDAGTIRSFRKLSSAGEACATDSTFENRRFEKNAPTPGQGEHWRAGTRSGVLAYTGWRA